MNNLGFMFEQGWGCEADVAAAVGWYRRAAARGLAQAQYNMGVSVSRVHPGSPPVVASSARARPDARVDASRTRRAATTRTR